jgi:hypothetical protein
MACAGGSAVLHEINTYMEFDTGTQACIDREMWVEGRNQVVAIQSANSNDQIARSGKSGHLLAFLNQSRALNFLIRQSCALRTSYCDLVYTVPAPPAAQLP